MLRLLIAGLAASLLLASAVAPAGAAGRPSYLVGTSDGSNLRFAVDGNVVAQARASAPANQAKTPIEIGSFLRGEVFYGTIDEVAVYDRPMDLKTVARHYRIGTSGGDYERAVRQTPGLLAYWRLDDPTAARAADVLGRHPGVYRPGTALRVPGLLAHDANRAAAFDGSLGDVVVDHAADLAFPRGFTLEAWAAPGAVRDQAVVSNNSWFIKSDPVGHWGFGIFAGPKITSVYAKQRYETSPAPIALAPPRRKTTTHSGGRKGHNDSGSSVALVMWIAIVAAVVAGWLLYRSRRRRDQGDSAGPDSGPGDGDGDGDGSDVRDAAKVGS